MQLATAARREHVSEAGPTGTATTRLSMRHSGLLAFALAATVVATEVEYEDNVAVLTPDNFDSFIEAQDYTIVEFCACLSCPP